MKRSFEYEFKAPIEKVFDELVLNKNADKWLLDDYILGIELIEEDSEAKGFVLKHKLNEEITVRSYIEYSVLDYPNFAIAIEKWSVTDSGENVADLSFMPFKKMHQRLSLTSTPKGTKVKQEVYMEQKNIFCWPICMFLVFPQARDGARKIYDKLDRYLT